MLEGYKARRNIRFTKDSEECKMVELIRMQGGLRVRLKWTLRLNLLEHDTLEIPHFTSLFDNFSVEDTRCEEAYP